MGKFLKTYNIPRESVVIMTKTYMQWGDEASYGPAGYVNNSRLSRKVGSADSLDMISKLTTAYFRCCKGIA